MSYDLMVYATEETRLEKERLSAALRERGWRTVYLTSDAFWNKESQLFLQQSGPLEDDLLLGAWPLECERAPQFENLASLADSVAFAQLVEIDESFTSCGLSISCPYSWKDEYEEEEWEEICAEDPSRVVLMERTRSYYYLRTSAGGRLFRFSFQEDAWQAIAKLTRGYAENPQKDMDWFSFEPNFFKRSWLRLIHLLPGK